MDRRKIWCLYVPWFQRLMFKHVPKCEWTPSTKFPRILPTDTSNVNFVGTIVLSRIPQQEKLPIVLVSATASELRKSKWIPQIYADSTNLCGFRLQIAENTYSLWIPLTTADSRRAYIYLTNILLYICGFQKLFRIPQILVADSANFGCGFSAVQCNFMQ